MAWSDGLPDGLLTKMQKYEQSIQVLKSRLDKVELELESYKKGYDKLQNVVTAIQTGVSPRENRRFNPHRFVFPEKARSKMDLIMEKELSQSKKKEKRLTEEELEFAEDYLGQMFRKHFTEYIPSEQELIRKKYWNYKKLYNWVVVITNSDPVYKTYFKRDRLKRAMQKAGIDIQMMEHSYELQSGAVWTKKYLNIKLKYEDQD